MIKKKILMLSAIASLLVVGTGVCVAATTDAFGVLAQESAVIKDDKTNVRFWFTSDSAAPLLGGANHVKVWAHKNANDSSEGEHVILAKQIKNKVENNRVYFYADMPLECYSNSWYFTIQAFKDNAFAGSTITKQFEKANVGKVGYVWKEWSKDFTYGSNAKYDAAIAALALEGIYTCSTNEFNGGASFANIKDSFFGENFAKIDLEEFKKIDIKDFSSEGGADWNKPLSDKTLNIKAIDKYNALAL